MRRAFFVLSILAAVLSAFAPAHAGGKGGFVEVSPFLGAYFFDNDLDSARGPALGVRGGYLFDKSWEAEAGLHYAWGKGGDVSLLGAEAGVLYHLPLGLKFPLDPYLSAGLGSVRYDYDVEGRSGEERDWSLHYGAGAKYYLRERFALRGDIRQPVTREPTRHNLLVSLGVSWFFDGPTWGGGPDADGDGVPDAEDRCPNTPAGLKVDHSGCIADSDTDGVPDSLDRCPGTPLGERVDADGCPEKDSDGDGVPDSLDRCPGTRAGARVDDKGCEKIVDSDEDGVPDDQDRCPGTVVGVRVDSEGCPLDEDGDGVLNRLDKCPGTPKGAKVDDSGCIVDADGDGVDDNNDRCPNTPKGMVVDSTGCIADSDGDGIPDSRDRCPGSPQGAKVDAVGCPVEPDADGDGLPDEQEALRKTDPNNPDTDGDQLPDGLEVLKLGTNPLVKDTDGDGVPDGVEVNIQGTDPLVPAAEPVKELKRMELAIQFALDSDVVEENYKEEIARAARFLKDYPEVRMTVEGHTDDTGEPGYNQDLSERRARNVAKIMIETHGIAADRIRTAGYGESRPVASNDTAAGRAKNRRILAVLAME